MSIITNREPFAEVARMNRILDRWFGDHSWPGSVASVRSLPSIAVDIYQENDQFIVKAAVPGVPEDDLDVSIQEGVLTIRGETRHDSLEDDSKVFLREISYGAFSRSIRLPEIVNTDEAEASFENGWLWIAFPIQEPVQPERQRLEIKPGRVNLKSKALEAKETEASKN